ncbi:hypothetical protein [Streptomyces sp. R08]|uniref:Uncharacterized protein n=1 Tax=Streptomyces sp. R08 TaxID=3238624 RepID=A0AB39MAZ2_9ACTN
MEKRVCSTCGEEKPVVEFHKDGDGVRRKQCATCRNGQRKDRRDTNPAPSIVNRSHIDERMKRTAKTLGITPERFAIERMKPCAACAKEATQESPNTGVSNPTTGEFAGTVCLSCAKGFAFLGKDPERLANLLALFDHRLT